MQVGGAAFAFAVAPAPGARPSKGPTPGKTGAGAVASPARTVGRACPTRPAIGTPARPCRPKGRAQVASALGPPLSWSQGSAARAALFATRQAGAATSARAPIAGAGLATTPVAIAIAAAARGPAGSQSSATTRGAIAGLRLGEGFGRGRPTVKAVVAPPTGTKSPAITIALRAACL